MTRNKQALIQWVDTAKINGISFEDTFWPRCRSIDTGLTVGGGPAILLRDLKAELQVILSLLGE